MNVEKESAPGANPDTGQPAPDDPGPGPAPNHPGVGGEASAAKAAGPASAGESAAPGAAPSQQELAIRSALETVMDPEIGLSVVDLGLIRVVRVEPARTHVQMLLTTPYCPYAPQLMEDVKQAAMSVVPMPCEVEILPDAWSPDMMPDPGLLGYSF